MKMFAKLGNAKPNTENTGGLKWELIFNDRPSEQASSLSCEELSKIRYEQLYKA